MKRLESAHGSPKIQSIIERFFILAALGILIVTLLVGLYFNKYDENEKRKNNIQKTHAMLSHLIVPSMIISDTTEARRLLYMASGKEEKFIVVENDGSLIMPDYSEGSLVNFIKGKKIDDFCKNRKTVFKRINRKKYLVNCSILQDRDMLAENKNFGVLLSFTDYALFSFSPIIIYFLGVLLLMLFGLVIVFRKLLYRRLLVPLIALKDGIRRVSLDFSSSGNAIEAIKNAPMELLEIKHVFDKLLMNLKDEYGKRVEAEKLKALIDLAAGVAHDIRSPLTALDVIIRDIKNIPEEQRIILRNSANRINDIANNLLIQYKQGKDAVISDQVQDNKPELISNLLMSLVSEKRIQHKDSSIELNLNIGEDAQGKFSNVSALAFNRVLSNLIDNAIEAGSRVIIINLNNIIGKNALMIQIIDNGEGMSDGILHKILKGENFTNKATGHGLGLQYAIQIIRYDWGGDINITSTENQGTMVTVTLLQTTAPKWFLPCLPIDPAKSIVIVDDDESIHQVWKQRFTEIGSHFNFVHLYSLQDLMDWCRSHAVTGSLFLIDYEFYGFDGNGLTVIDELGIAGHSCLVTSRHDDVKIRDYSEKIGLKIIPKTYAVYIPIQLIHNAPEKTADFIFIDDDISITGAWVLHGMNKGKVVAAYNSIHDFMLDICKFHCNIPIYIDSDLNDKFKGQDYGRELYEKGFANIFLATGYADVDFPEMYWIKKIVGKEPPF